MNITVQPNGDLKIAASNAVRAFIADAQRSGRCYSSIMADLFEWHACNGSYEHFDAGRADPFVGITSAPCVAEAMHYPDDGPREVDGRLWWFPDYMIRDDLAELKIRGYVVYRLVDTVET